MITAFAGHDSRTEQGRGETAPRLRAQGPLALGLWEQATLLPGNATEGTFLAKKRHSARFRAEHFAKD
jgi:hypothetical protein